MWGRGGGGGRRGRVPHSASLLFQTHTWTRRQMGTPRLSPTHALAAVALAPAPGALSLSFTRPLALCPCPSPCPCWPLELRLAPPAPLTPSRHWSRVPCPSTAPLPSLPPLVPNLLPFTLGLGPASLSSALPMSPLARGSSPCPLSLPLHPACERLVCPFPCNSFFLARFLYPSPFS